MKEEKIIIEIGERLKDVLKEDLKIISLLYPGDRRTAIINFNDNFKNCLENIKSEK